MIWTNGVGASTGMFVPALAIGATGGRMFGRVVKLLVRCAAFAILHGHQGNKLLYACLAVRMWRRT